MSKHYLLYGPERYALAILRPLQEAIRARGHEAAWFFDGPGGEELRSDETFLRTTRDVRQFAPIAVLTSSNAVPHFFPGVKVEVFHGFDAGKPRHIYIRGFFDLYCTTGARDTQAFTEKARELELAGIRASERDAVAQRRITGVADGDELRGARRLAPHQRELRGPPLALRRFSCRASGQ